MRTTTAFAFLVMLSGAAQASVDLPGSGQSEARFIRTADSAHTLFQANPASSGGAGRIVQLPQGGYGVTTGGTSYYQTFGTPGGSGVMIPNGNGTSSVLGSGGRVGIANTPG
jgi:hypothetical protein